MRISMLVMSLVLAAGLSEFTGMNRTQAGVDSIQGVQSQAVAPAPAPGEARSLDRMIDSGAVAYLEIKDVGAQLALLRAVDLIRSFMPLATKSGSGNEKEALETLVAALVPELQGAHLSVAMWPEEQGTKSTGKKPSGGPQVGVVVKFPSTDQLQRLMQRKGEIEGALRVLLGEETGREERNVKVMTVNELLVAGDPGVVNRLVNVPLPTRSLADDVEYQAARTRWPEMPIFLYGDLKALSKLGGKGKKQSGSAKGEDVADALGEQLGPFGDVIDFENLPKLAAAVRFQESHTVVKGLLLDRRAGAANKGVFSMVKPAEDAFRTAKWLSPQADVSLTLAPDWQGLYDMIVPPLEKLFSSKEGGGSPIPMIEAVIGYKIRDQLLPALGSVSLSVESLDPVLPAVSPSQDKQAGPPNLSIMVSLRNREVVEGAIKNVMRMMPSEGAADSDPIQQGEVQIRKLGDGGYAIVDNLLVFSPDLELLKQKVKPPEGATSLASEPDFTRAFEGLPQNMILWGYMSSSAVKRVFESLRKDAIKEEPRLGILLETFPSPSHFASVGGWREETDLVSEVHLPSGILPALIASGIASDRVAERDRAITEKAKTALSRDPDLADVEVTTKSGEITLYGTVTTARAKTKAQELVEKIDGVRSVVNEIDVEPEEEEEETPEPPR